MAIETLELASLAWVPNCILDRHVLQPMRLATMGTVIAAKTALETGIGINLSGGYHHASSDRGAMRMSRSPLPASANLGNLPPLTRSR